MYRATRRSRRLADQRRRAGQPTARMSVGEALDVSTYQVDVTNLPEARAMDSARTAAANLSERKPKRGKGRDKAKSRGAHSDAHCNRHGKRARGRNPNAKPYRSMSPPPTGYKSGRARSAQSNRSAEHRRAKIRREQRRESQIRNSLSARKYTRQLFDSGEEPPAPDESGTEYSEGKSEGDGDDLHAQ